MPSLRYPTTLALDGDRALTITRSFAAPRALVFDAWTTAEHLRRWWAPAGLGVHMEVCEVDARVGGRYRFVVRASSGHLAGFSGVYTEVVRPERLVYLETFDPFPDAAATITLTFTEQGGVTTVHSHEVYPSAEAREGALSSGMEHGMRDTMEQLAELLAALQGVEIQGRDQAA